MLLFEQSNPARQCPNSPTLLEGLSCSRYLPMQVIVALRAIVSNRYSEKGSMAAVLHDWALTIGLAVAFLGLCLRFRKFVW